jgi:hypothetical protein
MPSRRAVSLAGIRGAFSLPLNPRPAAPNARECAVRHCTFPGNPAARVLRGRPVESHVQAALTDSLPHHDQAGY